MRATGIVGVLGVAVLLAGCQDAPATPAELPRLKDLHLIARDSSGLGHDGLNQGSPEVGVPGRRGTAYSFSTPGSWIRVANTEELHPKRASFLVGAWVNLESPPAAGGTIDLVRKGLNDSRGGEFKLEIVADGRIKCTVKDAGHHDATTYGPAVDVTDGAWHWVACARTPRHLTAIVDDQKTFKQIVTGVVRPQLPLAIGSKYGLEDRSDSGRVDEVVFYIARTPDAWVKESPPLRRRLAFLQRPDHAVGVWHLDEAAGG